MGALRDGDLAAARQMALDAWEQRASVPARSGVRDVVARSWQRSMAHVVAGAPGAPVDEAADLGSEWRASPLHDPVRTLATELDSAVDDGGLIAAVTDDSGKILWSHGSRHMRRRAERVNFVPGGRWDEGSIGTNALALALRTAAPHEVFAAEHYAPVVHDWVCYSAPIIVPATGRTLGVFDLSTTWERAHPLMLTTAISIGAALGHLVDPRRSIDDAVLTLRVLGSAPGVWRDGQPIELTRRQLEVLTVLAAHPEGMRLEALHAAVYGDTTVATSTVKAEVSHLRRILGGGIASRPYRLELPVVADHERVAALLAEAAVERAVAAYDGPLLPTSDAPFLVRRRAWLHTALRAAALQARSVDCLVALGRHHPDDLELHERCLALMERDDPRRPMVEASRALAWCD